MVDQSQPKAHHKISKFYLEGWAVPALKGKLWSYKIDENKVFPQLPQQACRENNLHRFRDAEGNQHTKFETWLSVAESYAGKALISILDDKKI